MTTAYVTYGNLPGIRGGRYTLSSGTLPDQISLDINPLTQSEAARIPVNGTIAFHQGTDTFYLHDCLMESVNTLASTQGQIERLRFFDRRWRWAYGHISGRWPDSASALTAAFRVLGETVYWGEEVRQLLADGVDTARSCERPVDLIETIVRAWNLLVFPLPSKGEERVTAVLASNVGDDPPASDDVTVFQPSIDVGQRPGYIKVAGAYDTFRQWFALDPVLYHEEDDKWYYVTEHPLWDDAAANIGHGQHSRNGYPKHWDQQYCKYFAVSDPINKDLTLGVFDDLTKDEKDMFLAGIADVQGIKEIRGTHRGNEDTPQGGTYPQEVQTPWVTEPDTVTYVDLNGKEHERTTLVHFFQDPMIAHANPKAGDRLVVPAFLYALIDYNIELAWGLRNAFCPQIRFDSSNELVFVMLWPDLQRLVEQDVTSDYDKYGNWKPKAKPLIDTYYYVRGTSPVTEDYWRSRVLDYANSRFPPTLTRYTSTYRGIQAIPLSGRMRQITWNVSNEHPPWTKVYVNFEGDPYVVPEETRRMIQDNRRIQIW